MTTMKKWDDIEYQEGLNATLLCYRRLIKLAEVFDARISIRSRNRISPLGWARQFSEYRYDLQ